MPEIAKCPDCGRRLRVPEELLGRAVRCPGCKVIFLPGQATPPREPDERIRPGASPRQRPLPRARDDEADRRRYEDVPDEEDEGERRPARKKAGWRKVRDGLNLVLVAFYLKIGLVVFLGVGGAVAAGAAAGTGGGAGLAVLGLLFGILVFLVALTALVFDLVGLGRCMEVPDRPGGALKPLAIAAFSLVAAQFGLGLFSGVLQAVGAARAGVVFGVLGNVAGLAQFFCFLFFLRGTAGAVRQANLAAVLLIHTLAWVGFAGLFLVDLAIGFLTVGPSIFPGLGPPDAGPPAGVPAAGGALLFAAASCLTGVAALGMAVWYILIVHQVRDAVDRSLRRP